MRNKIIDLHNALFAELEALQDEDSFKDENGNKVRNDRDIENDYINGRYGAIPFIN